MSYTDLMSGLDRGIGHLQQASDRPRVLAAASLKAHYAMSYADAFAAALAQQLQVPVVTGDPEFHKVAALVEVFWLP